MGSVRAVLEVLKLSSAVDLLQCLSCVSDTSSFAQQKTALR